MLKEILDQHRQVVGVFSERETAGQALDRLVLSGFPIAQAFLVGPSWTISERHDADCSDPLLELPASNFGGITGTVTGLQKGLVLGNLIGGSSGLLLGLGLLALPGVGASCAVFCDRVYAVEWWSRHGSGWLNGRIDWLRANL